MAGDLQARRRKIRERVKDAANDDSADDEYEEPSKDGSTCLSAVVVVVLVAGLGLLFAMVSLQSGAVPYGGPAAPQRPRARPAEVVVEPIEGQDSPQPPPVQAEEAAPSEDAPVAASAETATAVPSEEPVEGSTLSATTESATADSEEPQGAPAAAGVAAGVPHTAAPSLQSAGAPPPPTPPPAQSEFRLEGSEASPAELELQPVEQKVRVRQLVRQHTHADGSVTEEIVSEQILQPGDEGYDDLGAEPVTVSVSTGPALTTPAGG